LESTLYKILFILIAGSILHFVMLFVKWNKTKKLREELKRKQIKSFRNLRYKEISISSGGLLHKFNFGLTSTDVDLIFTNNQIQFLPTKFSFFLYASMLPFDINKRLDDLEVEIKRDKIIFYYTARNYEHGETQNKISILGNQMQLGELKQYLETWLNDK
jgi:hypothetical protein